MSTTKSTTKQPSTPTTIEDSVINEAKILLERFGTGTSAAIVLVVFVAIILVMFCLCKCCRKSKYALLKQRMLRLEVDSEIHNDYGREKDFLLTEKGGGYKSDRLTLLDQSSEDEF
uniref:uncharacterized protein LOC100181106 isoform X1 n=1 Tax=Ciona intestinalis TaxID=7719 RepID=UPI0005214866|nr:uncharacterized protein LOC100181106 isoform X1 [Ciona intestinalis]|eukprot:XP_026696226.1 uncharacterized protein LOC100181106 isoform X1 [Ciona intestinalis]